MNKTKYMHYSNHELIHESNNHSEDKSKNNECKFHRRSKLEIFERKFKEITVLHRYGWKIRMNHLIGLQ